MSEISVSSRSTNRLMSETFQSVTNSSHNETETSEVTVASSEEEIDQSGSYIALSVTAVVASLIALLVFVIFRCCKKRRQRKAKEIKDRVEFKGGCISFTNQLSYPSDIFLDNTIRNDISCDLNKTFAQWECTEHKSRSKISFENKSTSCDLSSKCSNISDGNENKTEKSRPELSFENKSTSCDVSAENINVSVKSENKQETSNIFLVDNFRISDMSDDVFECEVPYRKSV